MFKGCVVILKKDTRFLNFDGETVYDKGSEFVVTDVYANGSVKCIPVDTVLSPEVEGSKIFIAAKDDVERKYVNYSRPIWDADGAEVSRETFEITPVLRPKETKKIAPLLSILSRHNAFVAGGFAARAVMPQSVTVNAKIINTERQHKVGDVDVFFNYNASGEKVDALIDELKENGCEILSSNNLVVTIRPPKSWFKIGMPIIQIVKPRSLRNGQTWGPPEVVLDSFDFSIVRAALIDENMAIVDSDLVVDRASKIVRVKRMHCPVGVQRRFTKYATKGYHVPYVAFWYASAYSYDYIRTHAPEFDQMGNDLFDIFENANRNRFMTREEIEGSEDRAFHVLEANERERLYAMLLLD